MRIPEENLSIFHSITAENASRTSERRGAGGTNEHAPPRKREKEQVSKTVLILAVYTVSWWLEMLFS